MVNIDGIGVPLPASDTAWESWIQHVLEARYGRPANAYGRSGQKQDGIDFTIYDGEIRVGVQCKFVAPSSKLDVKQVQADITASRKIAPPIKRFVLYTSAPSDVKTVNALDELKPVARAQDLDFSFLMWRDFEEEVRRYNLFDRLYGISALAPAQASTQDPGQTVSKPRSEAGVMSQPAATVLSGSAALYSGMLDEVKGYMIAGDVAGAAAIVELLLKRSDTVPDTELARAYATKAILVNRGGDVEEAARLWRKSVEIEPSEDLRHGRRAQALLCEDRYEEALAAALPGFDTQPPSSLAALAALISAQHLGRRMEIDARLTGRLKSERDVGFVRAFVAMADGDLLMANEIAQALAKEYPDDADLMSLRADLLFHTGLGGPASRRAKLVLGSERRALEAAIPLYRMSLEMRDPLREKAGWLPSALNLASVLKLLERHEEAAEVAADVIDKLGPALDEIERLILLLAEGGKETRALELCGDAQSANPRIELARASALMHLDRFAQAETTLRSLEGKLEDLDADNLAWMLLATRMQVDPGIDLENLAREFYEHARNKLVACSRIFENASGLGYPQLKNRYAELAVQLYRGDPDPEHLPFVVDALLALDRKDEALRLLLPQVDLEHPQGGPLEERLAFCLLRLQRLESLDKLLRGLPTDASTVLQFSSYRIDYHLARGDREGALVAIQDTIEHRPRDLKLRALEVQLLREAGNLAEAKGRLEATQYQPRASLSAVALYVREARELGCEAEADALAYRWIRESAHVPEHAAWFLSNVLIGKKQRPPPTPLATVTSQCGVLLKGTSGEALSHWIVIDDRFPEAVSAGWFAPHSKSVPDLIGQVIKSSVEFDAFAGGPFIVETIVPVFDGAFFLIQSRYGREVPMADSLRYMSVKGQGQEEGQEYDFSTIFRLLDESKKNTLRALSFYAERPIPIGVMATALHRHPVDLWSSLIGSEHHVRAMSGDARAAATFAQRLKDGPPDIVLDPLTLMGWDAFGLLASLPQVAHTVAMTRSAVDVLRGKLAELDTHNGRTHMVLAASEQEGRYDRTDVTAEMLSAQRQVFERIVQWIDLHVQVVPVPTSGLPEDTYSALRIDWPMYIADSMQLAAHDNRILVADDIGLEMLCAAFKVPQVPTAALFRSASVAGRISPNEFARTLSELAKANYEFIAFSADDLFAITEVNALSVAPEVGVMLRYLRMPSLNLQSGLVVVCGYLQKLVKHNAPASLLTSSLSIALSAVSRHATRETSLVFGALTQFARRDLPTPYAEAASDVLDTWRRGHFLSLRELGIGHPISRR